MLNCDLSSLDEKHICPHCEQELACCNAPPFHIGDGLGWGSEFMFICLNDKCSLYVNGWKHIEEQFGHISSYRYMLLPGEKKGTPMMVGSSDAFKGCEVDPEAVKSQNERYKREKEAIAQLDTCIEQQNLQPILTLILDEAAEKAARKRACEILCKVNDLSCVDPIRNHEFNDCSIEQLANLSISKLLSENFKKECPYCAEIIKSQAKICRHCDNEL